MTKRLIKPFIDLHDPFFLSSFFNRPQTFYIRHQKPIQTEPKLNQNQNLDPHQVFQNFFNQNGIRENEKKEFFEKHYPSKVQSKFDPFKVLGLKNNATQAEIKQAYRKLAIKYHPKNNLSAEAQRNFAEVAKAYQQALEMKHEVKNSEFGFNSFFQDFDRELGKIMGSVKEQPKKQFPKQTKDDQNDLGQLYSQSSSYVQNINGRQTKCTFERRYNKDGNFLFVKRQQSLKDDGKTEIIETIDDGKQVRKKHYTVDKKTKKAEQIQ